MPQSVAATADPPSFGFTLDYLVLKPPALHLAHSHSSTRPSGELVPRSDNCLLRFWKSRWALFLNIGVSYPPRAAQPFSPLVWPRAASQAAQPSTNNTSLRLSRPPTAIGSPDAASKSGSFNLAISASRSLQGILVSGLRRSRQVLKCTGAFDN
ncbi:hypothetical protein ACJZ2D_009868 [Fusarium nematophilum]